MTKGFFSSVSSFFAFLWDPIRATAKEKALRLEENVRLNKKVDVERVEVLVTLVDSVEEQVTVLTGFFWEHMSQMCIEFGSDLANSWRETVSKAGLVPMGYGKYVPLSRVKCIRFVVSEYNIDDPR